LISAAKELALEHTISNKRSLFQSIGSTLKYLFVPAKDPVWVYLVLGGITLIALTLRVIKLNKPILYDEAFTFIQYASRSFKYILAAYSAPNNHIFHTVLVGIAYRLFGGHPWILRLPAFTAGLLGIPATFLIARRFSSQYQALAASMLIAVARGFINYSANGRGYTMLTLFALLLANFAALLIERQRKSALIAYALTGALGFYTIPVFLYPMAGISLWVAVTYLVDQASWKNKLRRLGVFLAVCALSGLMTFLLYAPVIFLGTGLESVIGNEIVEALTWSNFVDGLGTRATITWGNWMKGLDPLVENLLIGGFLLSVFFYRKASRQKLPLQIFLVLAVTILLLLQRVTPFGRVFLYLEAFYLIFASAGLIWLADLALRKVAGSPWTDAILSVVILLIGIGVLTSTLQEALHASAVSNRDLQAEEYAAEYILEHITPEDTIVSTAPVDIQTAYYLKINGLPFECFYQRDHPVEIQNALVLLRDNTKHNTPEKVLEFYELTPDLNVEATELVYEYGRVKVYSVPAK
jgi:hypothetical protein